jgi:hypothetical protein
MRSRGYTDCTIHVVSKTGNKTPNIPARALLETSLPRGYATGFTDLSAHPLAVLNAYACLLLLVLGRLLFILLNKIIFFCECLSWFFFF